MIGHVDMYFNKYRSGHRVNTCCFCYLCAVKKKLVEGGYNANSIFKNNFIIIWVCLKQKMSKKIRAFFHRNIYIFMFVTKHNLFLKSRLLNFVDAIR